MIAQGKCYKCGGFLAVDDTLDALVCPFCGQAFVVAQAIQSFQETVQPEKSVKKSSFLYDNDFVVESDVLVHYNGYTKQDIQIPEGITAIGETAFQGMNNIESVHIPEGVTLICAGAFSGCRNLRSVSVPRSLETIDRDAFHGCTSLGSVMLPDSIRNIEAGAFAGCTALSTIHIPEELEALPWRIFEGCTSLKTVQIPKKVKIIEDCAFAECERMESVTFACMHAENDPTVGVERIGMNAFRNCKKLSSINLPDTIKFIGNQAFRACSALENLLIPESVKAVYPLAFADCTGLKQVTLAGSTELYKGSNPYKYQNNSATFLNCPLLLQINYSKLQQNYWAFPAYVQSQEPVNMANGRCRYCGGQFKGLFNKVCTVCKAPKDY